MTQGLTTSADATKVRVGGITAAAPGGPPPSPGGPQRPCVWISWDEEGRPSCEHGPAYKGGFKRGKQAYICRAKHNESQKRYQRSDKGRALRQRVNADPYVVSSKAMYELTGRVR